MPTFVRAADWALAACLVLPASACDDGSAATPAPVDPTSDSTPAGPATPAGDAPDERMFLTSAQASSQTKVGAQTLVEAENCAARDLLACLRLAFRYEQGHEAPQDSVRALSLYTWTCSAGSAFGCAQGGRVAQRSTETPAQARAPALLRGACEAGHLHACLVASRTLSGDEAAKMRALACNGGYLRACDPGVKRGRKAPAQALLARDVCPGTFLPSKASGGGTRLHPLGVQLEHPGMLVALPSDIPGYVSHTRSSHAGGEAGRRTSSASAVLEGEQDPARRLAMTLVDLAADCTLQPGTGAAMQAHAVAERGASSTQLGAHPAALLQQQDGKLALHAWIADRCALTIDAQGLTPEELAEAARYVNLRALGQLCQAREAGLRAGPR